MATCEFWFDFSSPFAYLASTQVERVVRGHELVWKPFLLGALFKSLGTPTVPLATFPEPKMRHALMDQYRWAEHWGVPIHFPRVFPQLTILPLRVVLQLDAADVPRVVHAFFRHVWVEDGDISQTENVARILGDLGLDAEALLAGTQHPDVKMQLKANTEEAVAKGIFGAPSFVVDGQVFWGQDRFEFVKRALEGWRVEVPDIDVPKIED